MRTLRMGIVGAGANGKSFCRIYSNNEHCDIKVVCDVCEDNLASVKEELRIPSTTTAFHEVTRSADVDAVSIHTPDSLHASVALDALSNGKHVFVEKPMATSIEDCQKMVRASEQSNLVLAVGMVLRTDPNFDRLARMVREGFFGTIFYVHGTYTVSLLRQPAEQANVPKKYSPAFMCSGTHTMDLMRWYAGEATEVMAYANEHMALPGSKGYDEFTAALYRFENGAIGMLSATWADNYDCYPDYEIEIHGSKATFKNRRLYLSSMPARPMDFPWQDVKGHPYDAEANAFVEAATGIGKVVVDGAGGARTTVAILSGVEAAKQGRPVIIPRL